MTHDRYAKASNKSIGCSCWMDGFAGYNADPRCAIHGADPEYRASQAPDLTDAERDHLIEWEAGQ